MVGVRIYIVDLILVPDASMPMWSRAEALYTVVLQHLDLIYDFVVHRGFIFVIPRSICASFTMNYSDLVPK